ncbi:hypothetical protein C8Q70DRAFT_1018653 [Cubamyces menziesii]|nr:hypothetical protein C8Q70DRAFT_1018653 [Cubamyces menziesii]
MCSSEQFQILKLAGPDVQRRTQPQPLTNTTAYLDICIPDTVWPQSYPGVLRLCWAVCF